MKSTLLRLALCGFGAYAGLCLVAFLFQRRMLYFPDRQDLSHALLEARRLGLEPWKDEEGRLLGWRALPSGRPEARLLVLHGNAGDALDRAYFLDVFQAPASPHALDIVLLEYPGYGPREGSPTETTLVEAAVQAIDRLKRESPAPILLAGESLGSAAAALAAARRPDIVEGLILIVPLKNVPAVARRHYPFLPTFLARDPYRADRALARLRLPVAFLLAGQDEVVFKDLGMDLFREYPGPKRLWIEEGAQHNTISYDPRLERWREMTAFVRSVPSTSPHP